MTLNQFCDCLFLFDCAELRVVPAVQLIAGHGEGIIREGKRNPVHVIDEDKQVGCVEQNRFFDLLFDLFRLDVRVSQMDAIRCLFRFEGNLMQLLMVCQFFDDICDGAVVTDIGMFIVEQVRL